MTIKEVEFKYSEVIDEYQVINDELKEFTKNHDKTHEEVDNLLEERFLQAFEDRKLPLAIACLVFSELNHLGAEGKINSVSELPEDALFEMAQTAAFSISEFMSGASKVESPETAQ